MPRVASAGPAARMPNDQYILAFIVRHSALGNRH
jgi:hypothetical protein